MSPSVACHEPPSMVSTLVGTHIFSSSHTHSLLRICVRIHGTQTKNAVTLTCVTAQKKFQRQVVFYCSQRVCTTCWGSSGCVMHLFENFCLDASFLLACPGSSWHGHHGTPRWFSFWEKVVGLPVYVDWFKPLFVALATVHTVLPLFLSRSCLPFSGLLYVIPTNVLLKNEI